MNNLLSEKEQELQLSLQTWLKETNSNTPIHFIEHGLSFNIFSVFSSLCNSLINEESSEYQNVIFVCSKLSDIVRVRKYLELFKRITKELGKYKIN
jgi:hypothetical protein